METHTRPAPRGQRVPPREDPHQPARVNLGAATRPLRTRLYTFPERHSWQQAPPDTATLDFRDIRAFDADHAVALSIGPGDASRIYRTADGGAHWQLTFRNTDGNAFYDCIAFFDHQRGLAMCVRWTGFPAAVDVGRRPELAARSG
jgi:hypothetical protein